MEKSGIIQLAEKLGLTLKWEFVPLSRSRNRGEKFPTLNWTVTLLRNDRPVLSCDYSAGSAHCPSYEHGNSNACRAMAISAECETGYAHRIDSMNPIRTNTKINPDFCDVLYSLVTDSDAIDFPGFEAWASEFGYDSDSRKAESIYRICVEHGLKLRSALGDENMALLRDAFTDY